MSHPFPPPAAIDWEMFARDVRKIGRITRPIHIKEMFSFGSQSTVMAIWNGNPIGLIPYLRVCQMLKLPPLKYFMEC